ncbi:MAG: ATP-dependent endonuclease [Robiginitomaculum sp.]|nr:MAG: ATP-dependent endonuclease [Robiginitomaculum sp.]
MYISKVQIVNYRNFASTKLLFTKGVNTIIGENGSGKTNLFRGMRLLLDDYMVRSAYRLNDADFHRGLGDWRGHWIIISLEFNEVSQDEAIQALFLHGVGNIEDDKVGRSTYNLIFRPKASIREKLSKLEAGDARGLAELRSLISIDDYETIFTGKSSADFTDDEYYKSLVGDFDAVVFPKELVPSSIGGELPKILSVSKEISFTFVQALRDVVADFQNNRTNPLLTLLKNKSGEVDQAAFEPIIELVNSLNHTIEELPDVKGIRKDIRSTIKEAAGQAYSPASLSIKSDLSSDADKLFQSLKLFVGESESDHEGAIYELSLGGANLIYLTLKLLEFQYQKEKETIANFLFIEEPEAHIHIHIQKTLFDRLNYSDTQIIYSTHSTHIAEVSNVKSINILGRNGKYCEAYQPSTGLSETDVGRVQRYLDAIRSTLLFAKSIILVEGDAEEILIPVMIQQTLGVSLDEMGVSLVNIRSTGFKNIALLFHDERIRRKCAIITDLDAAFFNTIPDQNDADDWAKKKRKALASQSSGASRKILLDEFCLGNSWVHPFYAEHTFEVDFIKSENTKYVLDIVDDVYISPATRTETIAELSSADIMISGQRMLTMADNVGKGWFAILLGGKVDHLTSIPSYILDALLFSLGSINNEMLSNIITYRLDKLLEDGNLDETYDPFFRERLEFFLKGKIDIVAFHAEWHKYLPNDIVTRILNFLCPQ